MKLLLFPQHLLKEPTAMFPISRPHLDKMQSSQSLRLPPAAGLAGSLLLPWKPRTSVLAVHQLDSKLRASLSPKLSGASRLLAH